MQPQTRSLGPSQSALWANVSRCADSHDTNPNYFVSFFKDPERSAGHFSMHAVFLTSGRGSPAMKFSTFGILTFASDEAFIIASLGTM